MSKVNHIKEFFQSLSLSDALLDWVRAYRFVLLFVILGSALWFLIMIVNVRNINSLIGEIRELEKSSRKLDNINERYMYDIVNLQTAERIIKIAEEQLYMEQSQKAPDILK
ncbi:hypothetical protein MASR1M45_15690 [Candidatus Kapaibacterium sp.]